MDPHELKARLLGSAEREIEEIGRGGMGAVYRVLDPRIMRDVARKRLTDTAEQRANSVNRFAVEAQTHGQLQHPNIVPVHAFGVDAQGSLYMDMKLVRGRTLQDLLDEAGPRLLRQDVLGRHLDVLLRVCDAIAYAHSRGVIHLDLKPENIMVGEFGQVYVMDWGVSRILGEADEERVRLADWAEPVEDAAALVGTPAYMAPEQVDDEDGPMGPHTDVFQLGGLLYAILTGKAPYAGFPLLQTVARARVARIRPPAEVGGDGVPETLARIAMAAMARDVSVRTSSALAFKNDIERFLRGTWSLVTIEVPANTVFLHEGDPGQTAYVIESGHCEVFTTRGDEIVVLRSLGPGDVFGETAVFTQRPRSASIRAVTDAVLLQVDKHTLADGLGLNTWMGAFVRALAHRFRDVDLRLRAIGDKTP